MTRACSPSLITPISITDPGQNPGPSGCARSRQVAPIDDLIRFVLPAGEAVPDLKRKLPGRGLWVSLSREKVTEAARRNVFARSFKREVQVSKTLADDVER
jgi:predicted RNA-binding protein YlxR (DUF448 family)